jgi:hypothetical protein
MIREIFSGVPVEKVPNNPIAMALIRAANFVP